MLKCCTYLSELVLSKDYTKYNADGLLVNFTMIWEIVYMFANRRLLNEVNSKGSDLNYIIVK